MFKEVIEFKNKHSLIYNGPIKCASLKDIQFCEDVVDHLIKIEKETQIRPFSIATINPDDGLRTDDIN